MTQREKVVILPLPKPRLASARIAALEAVDSAATQALMEAFAAEMSRAGVKVAGLIQTRIADPATGRKRIALRDLASGEHYAISQDLGPGSVACNLDSSELAQACGAIERAARAGVDLVIISKFSKQEAARGGLADAFRAAIDSKTPIITAVSPFCLEEWRQFAGGLAAFTPPDLASLRAWWNDVKAAH